MMNRREFVQVGIAGLGSLMIPRWAFAFGNAPAPGLEKDPHFFLQIYVDGGMDPTYLFDARPLAMTQAGKLQNYLGEEPKLWEGVNGGKCWATKLTDKLVPFRERFSIVNGVQMSLGFDGHGQNVNYLLTGDPFGGDSFIPHLNLYGRMGEGRDAVYLIDAVQSGTVYADVRNDGKTIPLSADAVTKFVAKLKSSAPLDIDSPVSRFLSSRMEANARGAGRFSRAAAAMQLGFTNAPTLVELLKNASVEADPKDSGELRFVKLVGELFRRGLMRSAILVPQVGLVDTHDGGSAKQQPELYEKVSSVIATILQSLQALPYDEKRSLLDVTTIMVSSEFGRTMRQEGLAIDKTGTDHNPLTNTILLGGKGIRGGCVFGASDFQTPDEKLSPVHQSFDPQKLKLMGRPFDFTSMSARDDLPKTYKASDYLGMSSVANTVYALFGVPEKYHRLLARNEPPAPILSKLLTL